MIRIFLLVAVFAFMFTACLSQNVIDLQPTWLTYKDGAYQPRANDAGSKSVYLKIETSQHPSSQLRIASSKPYFLFINGKLSGEFTGSSTWSVDSIASQVGASTFVACIFQDGINSRELKTSIISKTGKAADSSPSQFRPSSAFKDFVIVSGLIIIIFFIVVSQLNPKLAADYFSLLKVISPREADDAQSNARLTSSNNFQFYIGCSLMLGFYLMIILRNLPEEYALPLKFQANTFWALIGQWIKLSSIILGTFVLKIIIVFLLTRLFNMRGLARVHFFNWMRLLLVVIGAATAIIFCYYITRGQNETFFVAFLSVIVATLIGWIFIVFMKLNGKTEHSMFHLFSYICATELIPLLITIKVLFQ